jgi:hypothetical protein
VTLFRRIRQRRSSHQVPPIIESMMEPKKKKKKSSMLFPWWCLFIAYGLSYLLIGTCILLIIARGIEFGDTKVEKWLTSMISGFFSSIFLSQPIKVCLYEILLMNSFDSFN